MKKIASTRSFLLTETTYTDGSVSTDCRGDITDMEVELYLRKKKRRGREPEPVRFSPAEVTKQYPTR